MSRRAAGADPHPPWGRHMIPGTEALSVHVGPRRVRFLARGGELLSSIDDPASPSDPGLRWTRWATPGGEREIFLRPTLPDRSLVLEPESHFHLLPLATARIFVRVPLWIRMELLVPGAPDGSVLLEHHPTITLSDTWWGSLGDGELAYWLPTTARREMRPELFQPHLAVCPLLVTNRSATDLRVEKVALRVSHLSLFSHDGAVWSDECRVSYHGEGEASQVDVTGQAPPEAANGSLIALPRLPVQRGLRARTFGRLATLSGLGGAPG